MEPFQAHFEGYLSNIREARGKGASHDYLRQVFVEFARKSFGVDPIDVELEREVAGTKLRSSIDALYQDIVFEFKRDLKSEREKGKEEVERYRETQVYFTRKFFGKKKEGGKYREVENQAHRTLEYPILQGALSRIGTWKFAAAVSEAGAHGCITGAVSLTPEKLREDIRRCREATEMWHEDYDRLSGACGSSCIEGSLHQEC